MSAKIFIATKPITGTSGIFNHLYLVYDADGNPSTINDQFIIRGGPEEPPSGGYGKIVIENGIALANSQDSLYVDPDDPNMGLYSFEDRFYTALDLDGQQAETVWTEMKAYVSKMGSPDILPNFVNTGVDYDSTSLNSNTVIASVLANSGLLIQNNLPSGFFQFQFPASDCVLGKSDVNSGDHLYIGSDIEYIDGRDGVDLADFSKSDEKVTIHLDQELFVSGSSGFYDTIKNIENIKGTDYDDEITGDSGINILNGGGGIDIVYGGADDDTIIFNTSENSFFAVNDERVYGGTGDNDKLRIELDTLGLTGALRDEILSLYHDWTTVQTGSDKDYIFSVLKLEAYDFETLEVTVDGIVVDLATVAKNDEFMLLQNGNTSGNLFTNNGSGADYTFGSALTATAGTFSTINGGTITISSDGSFAFTALASYSGVDSYTYTVTDTAGSTSVATATFNVQQQVSGTGSNENLNYTSSTVPVSVDGGGGDDILRGSNYSDYIAGGDGNDFLYGLNGNDYLVGGNGNDQISGDNGNDYIDGGDGNDSLTGGAGDDLIFGGSGDDLIYSGSGVDFHDGGLGFDKIGFGSANQGVIVDLQNAVQIQNDGWGNSETLNSIESIINGTSYNDHISLDDYDDNVLLSSGNDIAYGRGGTDYLQGGNGNDTLYGGDGNDNLEGGLDNDTLHGEDGNDILYDGAGDDILYGGAGDDFVHDNGGNDYIDGGEGSDTIVFAYNASQGIYVDLSQETVFNDGWGNVSTVLNVENINISANSNSHTLIGNSSVNQISGGAGNDTLNGKGGSDSVHGGDGNDTIIHNLDENIGASDYYTGGSGSDTLEFHGLAFSASQRTDILKIASGQISSSTNLYLYSILGFETIKVFQDNIELSLDVAAKDDNFNASNASILYGNVFDDNGNGEDYSFDSSYSITSGTFSTISGGSVTLSSDGSFAFTAVTSSYVGSDSFSYTLLDSFGSISVATVYLNVSAVVGGTSGNDTLTGSSSGDTIYGYGGNDTIEGGLGADTMIGGTGNDTYYVDDAGDIVTEASGEGTDTVHSAIDYTLGANVENLTLLNTGAITATGNSLNNALTGNAWDNIIYGMAGDDILDGSYGSDTMYGGTGNDTFIVDLQTDVAIEYSGEGTDTVEAWIDYTLGDHIENLTLVGSNMNGTGNALNNTIIGTSGTNILDGGAGNDTLIGGAGGDTYIVDSVSDVVVELEDEGTDTVQSSVTYTLTAHVEYLTLTGSNNINGTGNGLGNIVTGNSGNNILDGGAGIDNLYGEAGNDTYIVDNESDYVYDTSGTDIVQSYVDFNLSYVYGIENLTLIGTANVNAFGDYYTNIITGNSGNNTLDGNGGSDTLSGGAGNDLYIYRSGDTIIETSGNGTDTVESQFTYTLTDYVENLTLTGYNSISGTGNGLNNVILGNYSNNTLDGGAGNDTLNGSGGNDTMIGGTGDDIFVVEETGDSVIEYSGEGNDTIYAYVTYTLSDHVENMIIYGSAYGTGNNLNNTIIDESAYGNLLSGMAGNDTLSAYAGDDWLNGGSGSDVLVGGSGADTFIFDDSTFTGTDTVSDFSLMDNDILDISDLLTGYTSGISDINDFVSITESGGNTNLFIDRDGTGGTYSSAQIATLSGVTGLDVDTLLSNNNLIAV